MSYVDIIYGYKLYFKNYILLNALLLTIVAYKFFIHSKK